MFKMRTLGLLLVLAAVAGFTAGCTSKPSASKPAAKAAGTSHAHPDEGPHEGCLIEWGGEDFHAEFTVDHDKKETVVYVLDSTGKKAGNVKPEEITDLVVIIKNVSPEAKIELKPDPMRTDAKGVAYVGTHEALGKVMEFKGDLSGKIKGTPHTASFAETAHAGHDHKAEKKDEKKDEKK
jgi:hypothetical protein